MEAMALLRMIFWIMAGGGTLLVAALLVLGGGHDVGHGLDVGHGPELGHGVHVGHEAPAHGGQEGPGPISLRTILAFIGGWGWGGLIGLDGLHWGLLSLPFGAAIGFVLAALVFQFMRLLHNQEATSTVGAAHMVGQSGMVLTAIPAAGTGEVRVNVRGTTVKCLARSESGAEIATGTSIKVIEEVGGTFIVRPA